MSLANIDIAVPYRRVVNDIRQPNLIPPLPIPELMALESERRRLAAVLDAAENAVAAGRGTDGADYVRLRAQALRDGTELPPEPKTTTADERERQARDHRAAMDAMVSLGDTICETIARHPEWARDVQAEVTAAQQHAANLRAEADAADEATKHTQHTATWLANVAAGNLYPLRYPTGPDHEATAARDLFFVNEGDVEAAFTALIAASRTGSL